MEIYGLKQKKKKKWLLIPIIVIAAALAVILAVGIIVNVTNAEHESISQSVRENTELKRQIEDLNAQIASLQEQLAMTQGELDARPTPAPETTPSPEQDAAGYDAQMNGNTSPRNYEG